MPSMPSNRQQTVKDPSSGLEVRYTDNGLKEGDLPGLSKEPQPLELGADGLPVGWEAPNGDR